MFRLIYLILLLGLCNDVTSSNKIGCRNDQLKYVYTPCDENNNRWRVKVPKAQNCEMLQLEVPIPGVKCSMQCAPGHFLNIETQSCDQCKEGEYSVGDGIRFASWDKLPNEFETRGYSENHKNKKTKDPCLNADWKPMGQYLESNGSSCRSVLKFQTELVKDGNITFTVKSAAEDAFFHVWVEDYEQNAYSEMSGSSNEMYYTLTSQWKAKTLKLKKGRNVVYFVASFFTNIFSSQESDNNYESDAERTVMIKEIVVRGYPYSLKCEKCEPGTFSKTAASSCLPCQAGSYSLGGSGVCKLCGNNEYAPKHSTTCFKKKPCENSDYEQYWDECKDMKTSKKYRLNNDICNKEDPTSAKKPKDGPLIPCPGCNPGFYNNGTACLVCPVDQYSKDGNGGCAKCPPNSRSVPGLHYIFWRKYPGKHIHLYCIAKPETGCKTSVGWTLHDSFISTGIGHADDAEMLMYILVPGFTKSPSEFKLTYKIDCPSNSCRLKIQSVEAANIIHDITTILGNTDKSTYKHMRTSMKHTRYRIVFDKKYNSRKQTFVHSMSRLLIYEVEVTNVVGGGAERCEKCAIGGESGHCIKCDPGKYIESGKCVACPRNTYLPNTNNPNGIASCKKCPMYTTSKPGSTECHSNCIINMEPGSENPNLQQRMFNLTALSGTHIVKGPEQYTLKGYNYHHAYQISLCGHPPPTSSCVNTVSKKKKKGNEEDTVNGSICRSTIIPDADKVLSTQPISIGKSLQSIVINSPMHSKTNESNPKKEEDKRDANDLVFTFFSERYTDVCKNGTSASVHLVCDPNRGNKGKLTYGDKVCKRETCDGCHFHFTWRSKYACSLCTEDDYETIQAACKDGKKTLRYIWKEDRSCLGGVEKPEDQTTECTIFEKSILDFKLVILGFLGVGLLLAIIVIVLCYRNRSLSYKYSRLIDASQTKDGELPAAETCMYEEGEEEEEIILSRGGNKKSKILDRLKGIGGNKEDFSEFETINLDSMKGKIDPEDMSGDGI